MGAEAAAVYEEVVEILSLALHLVPPISLIIRRRRKRGDLVD